MRSRDLVGQGIPRATLSRRVADPTVERVGRGLCALRHRQGGADDELAVVDRFRAFWAPEAGSPPEVVADLAAFLGPHLEVARATGP